MLSPFSVSSLGLLYITLNCIFFFLIQERDISSVFKLKLTKIFVVSKSVSIVLFSSTLTPSERVCNFRSLTRPEIWRSEWCENTTMKEQYKYNMNF